MDFIVFEWYQDRDGCLHEKCTQHPSVDEAKRYADHKCNKLKKLNESGDIDGYSVSIYEITNH